MVNSLGGSLPMGIISRTSLDGLVWWPIIEHKLASSFMMHFYNMIYMDQSLYHPLHC